MGATKSFAPLSPDDVTALLSRVRSVGMSVYGSGPWTIDTHQKGVKLSASYDQGGKRATVTITDKPWYATWDAVWAKVSPLMQVPAVSGAAAPASSPAWSKLASSLDALDAALGVELVGPSGKVLGIVGDDWTPPTTDPSAQVDYLEKAYEHTKEALARVASLPADARKDVEAAGRKVGTSAVVVAQAIEDKAKGANQALADKAHDVKEKFKGIVSDLAPVYLGIGVGAWLIIGAGVYLYLEGKKTKAAA